MFPVIRVASLWIVRRRASPSVRIPPVQWQDLLGRSATRLLCAGWTETWYEPSGTFFSWSIY